MPTPIHPGDGIGTATGTGSENSGKTMSLEIDGDTLTTPLGEFEWNNPPGGFYKVGDANCQIVFYGDDTGFVNINGKGHSFSVAWQATP